MEKRLERIATSRASYLATDDVEAMVKLVGDTCDPTLSLSVAERRALLVRGVAKLVDADIWLGGICCSHPDKFNDSAYVQPFDGGWRSEAERIKAIGITQDLAIVADFNTFTAKALVDMRTLTYLRSDVMKDEDFYASKVGKIWNDFGFDHFMICIFPMDKLMHSAIGLHRRLGRLPFTERDRTVVHVVWQQVEWLHRQEVNAELGREVVELSLRERQVLLLLLGGKSRKEAAATMELSEHTVNDYMKAIYRKLDVRSRGELLAKFIPSAASA